MSAAERILIVGAGQAGARAAEALRGAGFAGEVGLIGDEPELPYERPALSKGVLLGEEAADTTRIHPAEFYREQRIALHVGVRAEAISPGSRSVLLSDGVRLDYDKLLLCTGSRVRPLIGADDSLGGLHYLRTLADCARLARELQPGRRMVVIGGGFIGLEVASSAAKRGLAVTVVERQSSLLERALPADIAAHVERLHRERGVAVRTGAAVARIAGDAAGKRVAAVEFTDGSALPADLVVVGIGIIPNTELAEAAGAESADGVVVDEYGCTSVEGIWAAGDVTNHFNPILGRRVRLESWQNAQNQAIAVARNMVQDPQPYAEVPWFWSDQHGVNIQMAGVAEARAQTVWRGEPGTTRALAFSLLDGRVVCAVAFNAGGEMRFVRKLIETRAQAPAAALADIGYKLKDLVKNLAAEGAAA
ncbi:MAG: FAD-dependent oxidoreductase [Betaproteobacteria bacterium]|nr:FAD-dependent oxidoreductase [Betaproteobacteria bacterium]